MVSTSRYVCACRLFIRLVFGLAVTAEAHGAQLTTSWVDHTNGVASTRVERRLATSPLYEPVGDVPPGVTEYVDAAVISSMTYCYRVFAYDATRVSPYSNEACGTAVERRLTVTVGKTGAGTGTVVSTPAAILCGTACSATFPAGMLVILAATPAIGSTFTGWSSGGCAGTDICIVTGNTPVLVTAGFSLQTYPVVVLTSGAGRVTSSPAGIDCGLVCSAEYGRGTVLRLTAVPAHPGVSFAGWSGGGCSGTSPTCVITLEAGVVIGAAFRPGLGN